MERSCISVLVILTLFIAPGDSFCGVLSHYGVIPKETKTEVFGFKEVNGYEMTIRDMDIEKLLAIYKVEEPRRLEVVVLEAAKGCDKDFLFDNISVEQGSDGNSIVTYFLSDGSKKRITVSPEGIVLKNEKLEEKITMPMRFQ